MIHEIRSGVVRASCMTSFWLAYALLLQAQLCGALSDDGRALLAFKATVPKSGSSRVFTSWNSADSNPCLWEGVTCSSDFRVTAVNITGSSIFASCGVVRFIEPQSLSCSESRDACRSGGYLVPELGNLTELQYLVLPFNSLQGDIPRELGRLSRLQVLHLQGNVLSGAIPPELGNLASLVELNLECNQLTDHIPGSLGRYRNLQVLNLAHNKLGDAVPAALGNLRRLQRLILASNQLSKQLPPELQHICGSLLELDLRRNFFISSIPSWLGNCSNLEQLVLKSNYFHGSIPSELGKLRKLQVLDVSLNGLSGQVPASLGGCQQLIALTLSNLPGCFPPLLCGWSNLVDKPEFNSFPGPLPQSVTMLPKLQVLWAPHSGMNGSLPKQWSSELRSLNLAENGFTGSFPKGLGSCKLLVYLDVSSNHLRGELPAGLPASCMRTLNVSLNSIQGSIPSNAELECSADSWSPAATFTMEVASGFTMLNLEVRHDFSSNRFSGPIPQPLISSALLSTSQRLSYVLSLANNNLSGDISTALKLCSRLSSYDLNLSHNTVTGLLLGPDISNCSSLLKLDASRNGISGGLPWEIGELSNLTLLDLSLNSLTGDVPAELGKLLGLRSLVLSGNSISGTIPEELGQASLLERLDLSVNSLSGPIPGGLGKLGNLQFLLLNNNNLSGGVPEELSGISTLSVVNLSFNNLSGVVPSSGSWADLCRNESNFQGNRLLKTCQVKLTPAPTSMGQISDPFPPSGEESVPGSSNSHPGLSIVAIVAITSGCAIAVVLFVLALLVHFTRQRLPSSSSRQAGTAAGGGGRKEVITFTDISFNLTYENVVRATGSFGVDFLIGNGGFGATYKAELTPGLVVAVKRLSVGRFQGVQQFDTEIRTLGRIQHPNLVTLIGYHASEGEMFLIYNYFPRGNLESFIHNRSRGEITWSVVHKIALGIAEALAYLHDECVPRVLHRDIKPSNILLDNSLNAYLADFGLARLLGASETHATTDVAGTFGYVAPEYAMTCRVSDKADVYSYGVVLLELLSGKRALDPAFSDFGHGFNIVSWAGSLITERRSSEVFIGDLWELGPESSLLEALKLAVHCTVDSLVVRPSMKQVVDRLRLMREQQQQQQQPSSNFR